MTNYDKMMADIEKLLRSGMRYCFPQVDSTGKTFYLELNEEAFKEADGFLYLLEYAVRGYVKKAYRAGYLQGAKDGLVDAGVVLEVDPDVNKIGGERGFIKWESDDNTTT